MLCCTLMASCTDEDEPLKETHHYYLTYEQETQMEEDIENFLKEQRLYVQNYTGVHVESGYETLKGEDVIE